jgi:Uncharacterized protein conserved in bacteria (DUF2188)
MAKTIIRVHPKATDDWIVNEDGGREFGHYGTRSEALRVGRMLAHKRRAELVIQDQNGNPQCRKVPAGLFARLFGRR